MKIRSSGAAKTLTGSMPLLEINQRRLLLDCGIPPESGKSPVQGYFIQFYETSSFLKPLDGFWKLLRYSIPIGIDILYF